VAASREENERPAVLTLASQFGEKMEFPEEKKRKVRIGMRGME
jgi:hypothetical protein